MQETWLRQEGHQDVIIFMLGWAATPNAVFQLPLEGYDVLACYDHRELARLAPERFSAYRRIYLFAWSFGVWVSESSCSDLPLYKAVALNGTPYPLDDRYGMRLRVVIRTMQGLAKVGMNPFNDKAYGDGRHIPEGPFEDRSIEEKIDELTLLAEWSRANSAEHIAWDTAYIGDKDEIFPPAKMWDYWKTRGLGIGFESYHYPFADVDLILSMLD